MSEKRFELHSDEDTINIIDLVEDEVFNFQFDVVSLSDAKILVLRLNRLAEENEQLKSYKLYEDNKRLQSIIADLKKENEKLKKQVEDCRDYNAVLYKNCVQKDRRWLRRIKRVEDELEESIKENARLRELVVDE